MTTFDGVVPESLSWKHRCPEVWIDARGVAAHSSRGSDVRSRAVAVLAALSVAAGAVVGGSGDSGRVRERNVRVEVPVRAESGVPVSLPAPPTALVFGVESTEQGLNTLRGLHSRGVSTIAPRSDGEASLTRTTDLSPAIDAIAIESDETHTFVLDRASESVLVFAGDERKGLSLGATLRVGSRRARWSSATSTWTTTRTSRSRTRVPTTYRSSLPGREAPTFRSGVSGLVPRLAP